MSITQQKIISRLLAAASKSPQHTRVAAAICRGSKVLEININNHRSKYGDHIKCSGHAEVACIHKLFPYYFKNKLNGSLIFRNKKFKRKMRKLTIYIARHRHSTPTCPAHSQPCSNCSSVIKKIGIKKIVYVDDYGQINKCNAIDYKTNYITPGYRLYHQLNITPD